MTLFSGSAQNGTSRVRQASSRKAGTGGRARAPRRGHADLRLVVRPVQDADDQPRDLLHVFDPHAAGGQRGRAQPQALVTNGFSGSPGIMFLLVVMCALCSAASAALP